MKKIWRGPLDDVWIETDGLGNRRWVYLRSVYGTNEGLNIEVKKTDLAERGYERVSVREAADWIAKVLAEIERQRAALIDGISDDDEQ